MKHNFFTYPLGIIPLILAWAIPATCQQLRELRVTCSQQSYLPGATIAFQVFNHAPSAGANHSLYAELVNCNGEVFDQKVFPMRFNSASGSFIMPAVKESNFIMLHCYTMQAGNIEASHVTRIFTTAEENAAQAISKKISLQYYFEGGTWVAESPNKILVRCTDENGIPAMVSGKVIDSLRRIYGGFETDSDGYGRVTINPEAGIRYFITVNGEKGQYASAAIPAPDTTGVTLGIAITDSSIDYTIISYNRQEPEPDYKLTAYLNTDTIYTSEVIFPKGLSLVQAHILRNQLTEGYITFLLTDKWQRLCAKRTIYHAYHVTNLLQFIVEDTISHRQALVQLPGFNGKTGCINLIACNNEAATGLMQQAVSDTGEQLPVFKPLPENATSYNDRMIAVTMPPAGYDLAADTVNRYLNISGTIYNSEKKPVKNKKLNIFIVQKNLKKTFHTAVTDKYGSFSIRNVQFFDTARMYYQLADKSDEKNDIQATVSITPSLNGTGSSLSLLLPYCHGDDKHGNQHDTSLITKQFTYFKDSKTLEEVLVKGKPVKTASEKFAEDYISGVNNQQTFSRDEIDLIKHPEVVDNKYLFDFLKGRMGSLVIRLNTRGDLSVSTRQGTGVGIYLNDMEIDPQDLNSIAYLTVAEVALVRYYSMPLKPRMLPAGTIDPGGDLMIYTKRDFIPAEPAIKGLPKKIITGYSTVSNFSAAPANRLPSSIYWRSQQLPGNKEVIRTGIPAGAACVLVINAVNEFMAPVQAVQKLNFN